jgi:hypothetical protein
MLNPKFFKDKDVSNFHTHHNVTNDDKIGNIFLNMDTFKSKLSYSISEIELLKVNNDNNSNIIGVHNNRIEILETNLLVEHNYNIEQNYSIDTLNNKFAEIDQDYTNFKNSTTYFLENQKNHNTDYEIGIDIIKGQLDMTTQTTNTFSFELEKLTNKIDDFYNTLPKHDDIQISIDNHPIIKSLSLENDSIFFFKELHTNYDIYVKNKCISDFIENALDKRELNIIKKEFTGKLENAYNQLNTKIDNRIKIYAKNIDDKLLDDENILYGKNIILNAANTKIEFKNSNSIKNSIESNQNGLMYNVGNHFFIMHNNGNLGINIEKPKYTVDTNGSINTKLGFYEDGSKLISSQWKVSYGQLVYRDTPIAVNELYVENGIFINKLNSSILCTNSLGEITSKSSLTMGEIENLDQTISKIQANIETVDKNNCFTNGIQISEDLTILDDTLNFKHTTNKILSLHSSGDIHLHKYTNIHNDLMTISNGKVTCKPHLCNFIVHMKPNKKYTIKNSVPIQLEEYHLENGQVYLNDKIKIYEGIIFITNSSKRDTSNFSILQNNRMISGGLIHQNIRQLVINRYGSLAIATNGELLYKLTHQFQWSKLETIVFNDIIDIETDNINFYIISKTNGVFQSHDFKNWVSIKELLDINVLFIKVIDSIIFAVGNLKFNNEIIIYKKVDYWKKTHIIDANYMISTNKYSLIQANNNYLLGMSNGAIYIFNNSLDEWTTYTKLNGNTRIISMEFFNNQFYIYAENTGIMISHDLFHFTENNYFKRHINKIYSNFMVYNNTLYISNLNNLYQMTNNNLWIETTFDKFENISSISKYKYISNCSVLNNSLIDFFPSHLYLLFDKVLLRSTDIGANWVEEDIDKIPSHLEKLILTEITNITLFKDYDLEFNKNTSILKVLYKNTSNINTIIQFNDDYGNMTHLLYSNKITLDNEFEIISNTSQTAQFIFKCI